MSYSGSQLFENKTSILDSETIQLELIPLQKRYGYTELGHLFLKEKTSGETAFSHPVYVKY